MILTKLIFPKFYRIYRTPKTAEMDLETMKKKNYTEEAMNHFKEHNSNFISGFTETIDTTINRWLEDNKLIIEIIDIKYQGYADDNSNMSALIIYKTVT